MFKKIADKLTDFIFIVYQGGSKRHPPVHFLVFLILLSPILLLGYFDYAILNKNLTESTFARREAIAFLAASTLQERLDRIIDVGISLANQAQFQNLIGADKWDEAIKIMETVPKNFSYIERVALFDPRGTLKVATPLTPEISAVIGNDFSYRDYYQGVSKKWEPYVAEAIKPAVPLGYNLIPIAIPIKSKLNGILGIMLFNIKLDTISMWSRNIEVGPGGFVYIVDQKGNLIAHPTLLPAEDIIDFSSVPVIQKALRGESGVEIQYNPMEKEERVAAYAPVAGYGWGVIVQQPTKEAFLLRDSTLKQTLFIFFIVFAANYFLISLFLRVIHTVIDYRQREKIYLESIGDGMVAIDRSWNITLWNKAAESLTGYSEQEVVGKPLRNFLKLIRLKDQKENIAFIEEAIVYGRVGTLENDTVLIHKDGKEIPVGDSASPIFGKDGNVSGAIIIFRNISKEKESQLLSSDFAYASHQLRTPVTKALWNIEIALEAADLKSRKENLKDAHLAILSINRLSDHLLKVAEIDQGRIIPRIEPIKLADLFDGVLKLVEQKAKEKNVAVKIAPISLVASIKTDGELLKNALFEILENAIEYSKRNSEVKIGVSTQESGILITIQDFGIGIPKEQQQLIFTKFFRGRNVPAEGSGAGLGLYIAREYIKLLKGKVWFESEEGNGTTLSVLLPLS